MSSRPSSTQQHPPRPARRRFRGGLVALLALAGSAASQATLSVDALGGPGSFATIQSALDASASGDTILVAPGLYLETIDFLGKDVAVIADGTGGPATHIIDAQGDPTLTWGSDPVGGGPVVTFANGEGPGAVLEGFTVTGGVGWTPGTVGEDTGGIRIENASPTIRSCHVVGNRGGVGHLNGMSYSTGGGAGGLSVAGGAPVIEACEIRDNVGGSATIVWGQPFGCGQAIGGTGGLAAWLGDVRIIDTLFEGNVGGGGQAQEAHFLGGCQDVRPEGGAGALWAVWGNVEASGCVFSGNVGAPPSYPGDPGACGGVQAGRFRFASTEALDVRLTECDFVGNVGGALVAGDGGRLIAERCRLVGNTGTTVSHWTDDVWIWPQWLIDCEFIGNAGGPVVSASYGDSYPSSVQVVGCVITGHDAAGAPLLCGGIQDGSGCLQSGALIANSILWDNVGDLPSSTAVLSSCVQGGFPGSGNLGADPLFVRAPSPGPDAGWGTQDDDLGDLRLASGSPCIDAGHNGLMFFETHADWTGNVRFSDDPATADTGVAGALGGPAIVDMGPHEHGAQPSADWVDLGHQLAAPWPQGLDPVLVGAGALLGDTPVTLRLVQEHGAGAPATLAYLVLGLGELDAPFKGGTLAPSPDLVVPLPLDAASGFSVTATWPPGVPAGIELVSQVWIPMPGDASSFAASNGLRGTTP